MKPWIAILFLISISASAYSANEEKQILSLIENFDGKDALLAELNFTQKKKAELFNQESHAADRRHKKRYYGCLAYGVWATWPFVYIFEGIESQTLILVGMDEQIEDYITVDGGLLVEAVGSTSDEGFFLRVDVMGDPKDFNHGIVSYELKISPEKIKQTKVQIYNLRTQKPNQSR